MATGGASSFNNLEEMFQYLESSDPKPIQQAILECLSSVKEPWLVHLLVDYYFRTQSKKAQDILGQVRESHAKAMMEKLLDGMRSQDTRLQALQLLLYLACKERPWCHQMVESPLFSAVLKYLKSDTEVPMLMTGLLIIVVLLPSTPVTMGPHLPNIFDIFGRLCLLCMRKHAHTPDVFFLHLQVALYSLFHRLYGMYPCKFLDFISKFFGQKENIHAYEEIILPMLERVRLHPGLVMGNRDNEAALSRWKNQETQDVIVACSKLSLDLVEGSWEDTHCPVFNSVKELSEVREITRRLGQAAEQSHETEAASKPIPVMAEDDQDSHLLSACVDVSAMGESPSILIGLATPPSSHRNTPAASFLEANTSGGTPDTASRQPTPCHADDSDKGEKTPLSRSSSKGILQPQQQAKLGDSGKRPTLVTPKAMVTTAPNTTPVTPGGTTAAPLGHHHHHASPIPTLHDSATSTPWKSRQSAFGIPPRSPATRALHFNTSGEHDESSSSISEVIKEENSSGIVIHIEEEEEEKEEGEKSNKPDSSTAELCKTGCQQTKDPNDLEVEEINEQDDQFDVGGSPTSSVSTLASQADLTAESVRQFMKQVNRIRFNSLTSNSSSDQDAFPKKGGSGGGNMRKRTRARSCPPFKRLGQMHLERLGPRDSHYQHHHSRGSAESSSQSGENTSEPLQYPWEVEENRRHHRLSRKGAAAGGGEINEESSEETSSSSQGANYQLPMPDPVYHTFRRSTREASTQVSPPLPPPVTPALQFLFAPAKLAVCSSCSEELVVANSQSPGPATAAGGPGKVLTPAPANPTTAAAAAAAPASAITATTAANVGKPASTTTNVIAKSAPANATTVKGTEISLFSAWPAPELLDQYLKIGSELHAKELTRIPLTSKESVNWTHFGGLPPVDEVNILKGQILLLHTQLLYERHKRANHAKRNRRLLRKIAHVATLEEQQKTLTSQIKIQEQEIQQLSVSVKLLQEHNRQLSQTQESEDYHKLVHYKTALKENKDLRAASIELKNLLVAQREDYEKLQKKLHSVSHRNQDNEKELQICKEQLANTDSLKQQVFHLEKEVLLMQELQQKCQEKLHHSLPSNQMKAELSNMISALQTQLAEVNKENRKKSQLATTFQAMTVDMESKIKSKEQAIAKMKEDISQMRSSHAEQMKALEDHRLAVLHTNQQLEANLMELQCQLDQQLHRRKMEALRSNRARARSARASPASQPLPPPGLRSEEPSDRSGGGGGHSSLLNPVTEGGSEGGGFTTAIPPLPSSSSSSSSSATTGGPGADVPEGFADGGGGIGGAGRGSSSVVSDDAPPPSSSASSSSAAATVRERAETEVIVDSGVASRSSYRLDSDVSMRSVSGNSLTTSDSGCWHK